jgi:hypothetical protein
MRRVSLEPRRPEALQPSVWRLGEVLDELLDRYGLAEPPAAPVHAPAACRGDAGLFATADLSAPAAATY